MIKMPHQFFISHYSGDKDIAEVFSNALKTITYRQITAWFSSDSAGNEGLKPGDEWFKQILAAIGDSEAVVVLLTPNSINRPWLYLETGIAIALKKSNIIPVCIGINRDSVLAPLNNYQCYQLSDYRAVSDFFFKLLSLFKIDFEEKAVKPVLANMVSEISKISFEDAKNSSKETISENAIQDLKSHFDKRFIELLERPVYTVSGDNLNFKLSSTNPSGEKDPGTGVIYSVLFTIDFKQFKNDVYIDVRENDNFQDITNTLYFLLRDYVTTYSYLREWVITSEVNNKYVVIREISYLVPAKSIFKPDSKWVIKQLDEPYKAADNEYDRPRSN